jgi:hypothetical protein
MRTPARALCLSHPTHDDLYLSMAVHFHQAWLREEECVWGGQDNCAALSSSLTVKLLEHTVEIVLSVQKRRNDTRPKERHETKVLRSTSSSTLGFSTLCPGTIELHLPPRATSHERRRTSGYTAHHNIIPLLSALHTHNLPMRHSCCARYLHHRP